MKKIKPTQEDKQNLLKKFQEKLDKTQYWEDVFKFEEPMKTESDDRVTLYFTPEAFLKCQTLTSIFPGEVNWQGVVEKIGENKYKIDKICVPPQAVSGVRTIESKEDNSWVEQFSDDEFVKLRFYAHSHVNFSTSESSIDLENQKNIVRCTFDKGVQIFQIWNKQGDINTMIYDIDKNILYDRNDVDIEVGEEGNTIDMFAEEAKKMVTSLEKQEETKIVRMPANYEKYEKYEKYGDRENREYVATGYKWFPSGRGWIKEGN